MAGDELLLSVEAHLRPGLRRSALLNVKDYPNRLFHFGLAREPAELCPKYNFGTEKVPSRNRRTASRTTACRKTTLQDRSAPSLPAKSAPSRVEMWRGGLDLAYLFPALSFTGVSLSRPCSVSTSRSSNRTCAINASGSRRKRHDFAHEKLL